jgi:hypothetical protein
MTTMCIFLSHLAQFFLEWKVYQPKTVEQIKTHVLRSVAFIFSKIVPFMWKCGKHLHHRTGRKWQWHTHTHTHTHSEYVLLIAFSRQQWLRELDSMLRYTHIACLVKYCYSPRRFSRLGVVLASWRGMPIVWWSQCVLRYLVDGGHRECSSSGILGRRPYLSWLPGTIHNWDIKVHRSSCEVPTFLANFNQTSNFLDRFSNYPQNVELRENPSTGSRVVPCVLTDIYRHSSCLHHRMFRNVDTTFRRRGITQKKECNIINLGFGLP